MRSHRLVVALSTAAASSTIVAATSAARHGWTPVGEFAQAEFRIRGFWSSPPLLGAVNRLAVDGVLTQHPGPLAWWVMYPVYSLFGGGATGLTAATAAMAIGWLVLAVAMAVRRGGTALAVAVVVAWLVSQRAIGTRLVVEPWNPWFAAPAFLCMLVGTWAVLQGSKRSLVVVVFAASFVVQAHLGYLVLALSCCGVAAVGALRVRESESSHAGGPWKWIVAAIGCGAIAWALPLWEQFTGPTGNLGQILRGFNAVQDPAAGWSTAIRVMLTTLDVRGPWLVRTASAPDELAIGAGTLVFLFAWSASLAWARLRRDVDALRLHLLLVSLVVSGVITTSQIPGPVHDYLVPWWPILSSTIVAAMCWTAWRATSEWRTAHRNQMWRGGATLVGLAIMSWVVVAAAPAHVPGGNLSDSARDLGDQLAPLRSPSSSIEVSWEDPLSFGAIGYGIVAEFDRRGIEVGGPEYFAPALTDRLVAQGPTDDSTIRLVVVTGARIEEWDRWESAIRVAATDPRSTQQRTRWEEEREVLTRELRRLGGPELADGLATNAFMTRSDPRVPPALRDRLDRFSALGLPTAVYRLDAGATGPPA